MSLPLSVNIEMARAPERGKCARCGARRVLYVLTARSGERLVTITEGVCAECAGLRLTAEAKPALPPPSVGLWVDEEPLL